MVLIFLTGWGIVSLISYYNRDSLNDNRILSDPNAEKAAQAIHKLIIDDFDTIRPEKTTLAVQQIFDRFEENLDSTYNYTFYIVDDGMVNAFATLNGNIYLMRGLVEFADSPEILAAVIAHEMGHIQHRDFETRLSRNISISALEMIITGGNANLISELSKTLFSSKYDREQETAADDFAKDLLIKSGIHPENLGILFLGMERENNINFPEATEIFMSHPHLKSRIDEAIQYELPDDFEEDPFEIDWEAVRQELGES